MLPLVFWTRDQFPRRDVQKSQNYAQYCAPLYYMLQLESPPIDTHKGQIWFHGIEKMIIKDLGQQVRPVVIGIHLRAEHRQNLTYNQIL